jgi:hypothetical protein
LFLNAERKKLKAGLTKTSVDVGTMRQKKEPVFKEAPGLTAVAD